MGTGHLVRCLTLAEAIREGGNQVRFVCRAHEGNLIPVLHKKGMPVTVLAAPSVQVQTASASYADWLGVSQSEDAAQTIGALIGARPDWLAVDHYGLDAEWERQLRPHVRHLLAVDDLANRPHDCDVLLDQNYWAEGARRYSGLVPESCQLLVGPAYALLRPEYGAYRKTVSPRNGDVRRVLVYFGGTDGRNMTGLALDALSNPDLRHLSVDVVIGANSPNREALQQQANVRPHTTLHGPREHLADLMAQADLALGAGGATTWERMCLGLPSVVIQTANNQLPISTVLDGEGLIRLVGSADRVTVGDIHLAIIDEIRTRRLAKRSQYGMAACDGSGVVRVIEALLTVGGSP